MTSKVNEMLILWKEIDKLKAFNRETGKRSKDFRERIEKLESFLFPENQSAREWTPEKIKQFQKDVWDGKYSLKLIPEEKPKDSDPFLSMEDQPPKEESPNWVRQNHALQEEIMIRDREIERLKKERVDKGLYYELKKELGNSKEIIERALEVREIFTENDGANSYMAAIKCICDMTEILGEKS